MTTSDAAILPDDTCWQAISSNDSAYDGQFVYAVATTGIYCRPSCRSRLPKRDNVRYYTLPEAAEGDGYRPCKRCQPQAQATPDETVQRVRTVCRYIQAHLDEKLTLEALGEVVHSSPFHLQRTFKRILGITPRQYADSCRMRRFKGELRDGQRVTDAIYAAGYGASSRVYERCDSHLGMTPSHYAKGGAGLTIFYAVTPSALGQLLVAATERGVCAVIMGDTEQVVCKKLNAEFAEAEIVRDDMYLSESIEQLLAYLDGWQPHLDLPLDIRTTAFQQRVLDELRKIPFGETRTYGEIAAAIGKPKAARAVGRACGANPVPLLIPCHRVLGSNGSLTGYAYGEDRKRHLLDLEQQSLQQKHDADQAD